MYVRVLRYVVCVCMYVWKRRICEFLMINIRILAFNLDLIISITSII